MSLAVRVKGESDSGLEVEDGGEVSVNTSLGQGKITDFGR